jgi:hypothetical protein
MGLLDGFFNKEAIVSDTIENCLENLSEELGCKPTEVFIMIKPVSDEFSDDGETKNFKNWVYQIVDGKPKLIREITLAEILEG